MTRVIKNPEKHCYLSKLLGFNYTIQYKVGTSNTIADALSRVSFDSDQMLLLSVPHLDFIDELRRTLQASPEFQALLSKVRTNLSAHPKYHIHNELLLFQGRIWLDKANPYIPILLLEYHATPLGAHLGVAKTTHRLESSFFWSGLWQDIRRFVRECKVCQQTKTSTHRPAGLLQPLPIPKRVWEDLSMDFITHLPPSHGSLLSSSLLIDTRRVSTSVHYPQASPPSRSHLYS